VTARSRTFKHGMRFLTNKDTDLWFGYLFFFLSFDNNRVWSRWFTSDFCKDYALNVFTVSEFWTWAFCELACHWMLMIVWGVPELWRLWLLASGFSLVDCVLIFVTK